jgi:hypothetical protein
MIKIYFRDKCAWFEEGHLPTNEDQILLKAVTDSLLEGSQANLPRAVRLNEIAEYVLISDGCEGVFPDLTSFAEYSMNTDVLTPLPKEG